MSYLDEIHDDRFSCDQACYICILFICRVSPPPRPGMPGWTRELTTATFAISLMVNYDDILK